MKTIHDPRYRELIEKLIHLREERGITQIDLSKSLCKPQSYVAKVENFDRRLDVVEMADWLKGVGSNIYEFLDQVDSLKKRSV